MAFAACSKPSDVVGTMRVADSPVAIECALHSTVRLGDSTVVFGDRPIEDRSTGAGILPVADLQPFGAGKRGASGEGLGDVTTGGYTLVAPPKPTQYLVHAHPSQTELGRVYRADLPILSTTEAFARALARLKQQHLVVDGEVEDGIVQLFAETRDSSIECLNQLRDRADAIVHFEAIAITDAKRGG